MGWAENANKNPNKGKEKPEPTYRRKRSFMSDTYADLPFSLPFLTALAMWRRSKMPILREEGGIDE
jgi:hypothetical protein